MATKQKTANKAENQPAPVVEPVKNRDANDEIASLYGDTNSIPGLLKAILCEMVMARLERRG